MDKKNIYKILDTDTQSDYELYLNTQQLLNCQTKVDNLCNTDELQFQIIHQSEELYLKLLTYTLIVTLEKLEQKASFKVITLFDRAHQIQNLLIANLNILNTMAPKDYQLIRLKLGSGSGQGSPGFRGLNKILKPLWHTFKVRYLSEVQLTITDVYNDRFQHDAAFVIAEHFLQFDALNSQFYKQHFELVERSIGGKSSSLRGRDVARLRKKEMLRLFPELWDIRNQMTDTWNGFHGKVRDSLSKNELKSACPFHNSN